MKNDVQRDRIREASARYRAKNREKRNAQKREWYWRNRERVRVYKSAWQKRQPAGYWKRWPSHKPERPRRPGRSYAENLEANRKLRARNRANLSESYLRGWMSRETGYRIKPSAWPAALVEAKRVNLKLTRLWRKPKESNTSTN